MLGELGELQLHASSTWSKYLQEADTADVEVERKTWRTVAFALSALVFYLFTVLSDRSAFSSCT